MTAKSESQGHAIVWVNHQWVFEDTGEPVIDRPCAFCNRQSQSVLVRIPADLSCTGYARFKWVDIDACIASLVDALQKHGIDMRGSCCGHDKESGAIHLQDGRVLIIAEYSAWDKVRTKVSKLLRRNK